MPKLKRLIAISCAVLCFFGILLFSCENTAGYDNTDISFENPAVARLQSVTPRLTEYKNAYKPKKILEIDHQKFLDDAGIEYNLAFPRRCLAVWNDGIYIALEDPAGCRVMVTDTDGNETGQIQLEWGDNPAGFDGFTMDGSGRFYVNNGAVVYVFNNDGSFVRRISYSGIKTANSIEYWTGNIALDDEDNIYLYGHAGLISLDPSGELRFDRKIAVADIIRDSEGILIAQYATGPGNPPIFLRPDGSGTPEKTVTPPPPEDLEGAGYRLSYGGTEPYFADETGLYAADGQVCGWQDSAMILSEFSEFIVVSRERLVCLLPNRLVDGMYDVWLLSAPDEGEKIERYEISVAITASNYTVEIAAANFNRLSDKYRVIISDYTGYNTVNDITAGRARLDRDLTTGAIPDIMTIDPEMDWRRYVSKEMFVDLYELMDSDGEFNRSSILGMLLRLCEYRGSLYYLPDSFYINTLITHGSTGITSFTLSDAISAQKKLKDDDRLFPRSFTTPYLQSQGIIMADEPLLWSAACSFIDFDGAVCCLDSAAFVEYLDFMKGLYDADAALVRSGKLSDQWRQSLSDKALSGEIVYNPYMIGRDYPGANVFAYLGYIYDNSYNIAGYPSNDKNGSLITLGNMFAVSKNANSVDGAWSFIKYYFGDKYQNMAVQSDYALSCYPLPSAVSAFDAALEKSLNSVYEVYGRIGNMAPGGAIVALDGYPDDDSEHTIYTMSAQTVRTLTDFVNSAEVIPLINNDIMGILKEELISCFAGSIDTRSAAGRMQNRVSIYLSEQS